MTQEISTTTSAVVDQTVAGFVSKLVEYSDKLTAQIIEKSPEAFEGLLKLIQFQSGFALLKGLLAFLILITISIFLLKNRPKVWAWGKNDCDGTFVHFLYCCGTALFFVFTTAQLMHTLQFTTLIGIFYPEGYLALKALEAVGLTL